MSTLLYVQSSPRGERSYSVQAAQVFLDAYRQSHPGDKIVTVDVFTKKLPAFDGFALQAKYSIMSGNKHTPEEKAAWSAIEEVIAEFKAADKYLFAVPMWNFGIPYRLKHYLDVIIQPGYTFSFSPAEGYKGLVGAKPTAAIYTRGGAYPSGTPYEAYDLQKRYLEVALGFMGITGIKPIVIEPTLHEGPEGAKKKLAAALVSVKETAKIL